MGKSSKRTQSHHNVLADRSNNNTTTGCMCSIFQIFDFPNFSFASNLHHNETQSPSSDPVTIGTSKKNKSIVSTTNFELPKQEPSVPIGMEAPRNSLKSEEGSTSLSSIIEDEEVNELSFKNIQMGINQIKTSCSNGGNHYTPSRSSSGLSPATTTGFYSDTASSESPATKTPSLVARLMGLDLLPEPTDSPTTRDKAKHLMDRSDVTPRPAGTRSLPETPRASASRRSDADVNHRLSLQIHKEPNANDELDLSRVSCLRRNHRRNNFNDKENVLSESGTKSPGFYARQIVKQVKESVTRRAGLDITNREHDHSSSNNNNNKRRLAEQASSKQLNNTSPTVTSSSSSSCSPRLKLHSSSVSSTINGDQSLHVSKPVLVSSSKPVKLEQQEKVNKRNNNISYNNRRKMIMQEETFVFGPKKKKKVTVENHPDHHHHHSNNKYNNNSSSNNKRANINIPDKTKCKRNNNLLRLKAVPTFVSVKKVTNFNDDGDCIYGHRKFQPGSEVSQPAQESKSIIKTSTSESLKDSHLADTDDTSSGKTDPVALRHYITKILSRTGISTASHVSFTHWFSHSHPLDPSIFHRLESHYYSNSIYLGNSRHRLLVGPRSNRRLVFDVVDELLVDILRPYINLKPWVTNHNHNYKNNHNYYHYYYNNNNSYNIVGSKGKGLIETLCSRFESFPCKDCQVLEDIDSLIDQDLCDHQIIKRTQNEIAFEQEAETLVMEVENYLVDSLVHETALIFIAN